jgi:hypothetical protein
MNKLDLHTSSLTHPVDTSSDASVFSHGWVRDRVDQKDRLMVLVPDEIDTSAMTRQIWELAHATGKSVQLLSLCRDDLDEPGLRRRLAMMCALLQDGGVSAEAKVELGANWVEVIRRNHLDGDLIVCFAEQRVGLLHRPLSQILQSNLKVQVYVLSGLNAQDMPKPNWLSQIIAWTGSVGIIVVSFLLQIRITSLPQDWAQTMLMIFSVLGEIWLIWGWNNLFS